MNINRLVFLTIMAMIAMIHSSCTDEDLGSDPKAMLDIFPYAGDSTTIFTLDASGSSDKEDLKEHLMVRWDWENDGTWDTEYSYELVILHRFSQRGKISVKVELIDRDGDVSQSLDSIRIFTIPIKGSMVDPRDSKVYRTVCIEDRWWMAENLQFGKWIPSDSSQTDNGTIEGYAYNDDPDNLPLGKLYSWFEAVQYDETEETQGVCPPGWHIPSNSEWKQVAPSDVPYMFLNYFYRNGGEGGLDFAYSGYYSFLYEVKGAAPIEGNFLSLNATSGFWTSTHMEVKYQTFDGKAVYQRWNLCKAILNPESDSVYAVYDLTGLFTLGDRIHLRGDKSVYDGLNTNVINTINGYYVRCIKNR
jgi:uncharacterized protein (TIGR02145 family)